jgi:quercetin dioxygenase-like cupin family protein
VSFYKWDALPSRKINDLLFRKFVVGEKGMLVMITLKKGCVIPNHQHAEEQFTNILSGKLELQMGGKEPVLLEKGDVAHIPGNTDHAAKALEDTLDLDVFIPIKYDYLK